MGTVQTWPRVGPINHRCCPLPSEVSRYAGLYLVSVASLPHHLQATHLVLRPTLAEPKHFLLVTQPPRRAEGREKRERERGLGKSENGSRLRNEHITASFPLFPPCSALDWSDSSLARPKERFSARALHRTLSLFLIPQPNNSYLTDCLP